MAEPNPTAYELARRLLEHEAGDAQDSPQIAAAADRTCAKLRKEITPIIGALGFDSVMARAVKLAQTKRPFLAKTESAHEAPSELQCFPVNVQELDYSEAHETVVGVFANLLDVLVTFLGHDLSYRFIKAAWPEMTTDEERPELEKGA